MSVHLIRTAQEKGRGCLQLIRRLHRACSFQQASGIFYGRGGTCSVQSVDIHPVARRFQSFGSRLTLWHVW